MKRGPMFLSSLLAFALSHAAARPALPPGYQGKPFEDSVYRGGPQAIPGRIECAYFDLGGEGAAYHDTDAANRGNGVLNQQKNHQRPHATPYHWNFRTNEGVDLSYTKDFADFNHNQNLVNPPTNQFYIGWTDDGEWSNYTVDVKKAGRYRIIALYGNEPNTFRFSINHQPACECKFPVNTGSMHKWNKAPVGTITFAEAGLQLLTLHYNKGNNFAYFEFVPEEAGRPVQSSGMDSGEESVTTRWLPDPFPNVAPRVLDRHAVVEMDVPSPTPSVLLGVYDVENDPVSLSGFTQPAHGRAAANPDGTFTYTPQRGYAGEDQFAFTLTDGRGGSGPAVMHLKVIKPTGQWATTSFTGLNDLEAGGQPIRFSSAAVPRAVDWDGDGLLDFLVGADGGVTWFRNIGSRQAPRFAAGVPVEAGGKKLQCGKGRVAIAWVDMDQDGRRDLVFVTDERKVGWARNISGEPGKPLLAEPVLVPGKAGGDFIGPDIRAEIADWNGDGLPDLITGSFSGPVRIAYNVGTAQKPAFGPPMEVVDADGQKVEGSYNLNVRIADLNQDGIPDFVDSCNWGTINFRINAGSSAAPRLPAHGEFSVTGPAFAKLDLHALTDGPIVDFADFDGDGTIDLIVGSERGGAIRLALGESGRSYLREISEMIAAHPKDLGPFLADPANANLRSRMQTLQAALYDYVTTFATPSQKQEIVRGLLQLISACPQYFKLQTHDVKQQPGIPSLAAQMWLTTLLADYYSPATRRALAEAAQFTGGYRQLVEEIGLIYIDNMQNPRGAEAIYQWVRTIPREIYPGTGITANDWLGGGRSFLVRGHLKNTFNGAPVDRSEYGFGKDARAVIGERGSENWFMTVVHHEACHDVDAYVRKSPDLTRRWGRALVLAGGPDMRGDPQTGWFSWELTKQHFREGGLWEGAEANWKTAWKEYWAKGIGVEWNTFGFMRGNISWFYDAPQESLATQGNQFWNSTEGRLEVAIDRWRRGFKSNLSEVLLFMEIWSLGLDKMKFCENDNACRQVFFFARLRRNAQGYIDRIDLGDRYYEFAVNDQGIVTALLHTPAHTQPTGNP